MHLFSLEKLIEMRDYLDGVLSRNRCVKLCSSIHRNNELTLNLEVVPIPSDLVERETTGKLRIGSDENLMTAAEHLESRLAATYGWQTQKHPTRD